MIEVEHLTKRFGATTAVDDLSFTVHPGTVTGFLGPNGAGKSTAMRVIAGLARPTSGTTRVNGRPVAEHAAPLAEIGTLLAAGATHPGRTARSHLLALATTHGLGRTRVDEVLHLTGMESVADRRVGSFSMGMGQRLGLAAALLGDPRTIMLDEPINGLDPDGIVWVRHFLRGLAAEGRTVFLSRIVRAEWIKTRSVRSSYWTAAVTVAFTVLFAAGVLLLVAIAPAADVPDPPAVIVDNYGAAPGVGVVGFAFLFAYALVAVFGVLVVSTERSTGLLAATLAAVPRRTPVLVAKLLVSTVVGMTIGLVGAVTSFLLVQPQLGGLGLGSSLVDAGA